MADEILVTECFEGVGADPLCWLGTGSADLPEAVRDAIDYEGSNMLAVGSGPAGIVRPSCTDRMRWRCDQNRAAVTAALQAALRPHVEAGWRSRGFRCTWTTLGVDSALALMIGAATKAELGLVPSDKHEDEVWMAALEAVRPEMLTIALRALGNA